MFLLSLNRIARPSYNVIAGCGRLGAGLADALSDAGESVLVIDRNKESFRKLSASFGGLTLLGDAMDLNVLEEAELRKATALVCVTDDDNTNILIAQLARSQYGVKRVISRLYDPDRECVYRELGIDTICPSVLSARRIASLLAGTRGDGRREAL